MASYEGLRKLTLGDKPVVIKFKCAGTNLRVPIAQVPTYNELCFIIQRLFRTSVSTNLDNYVLRYEDEDGDLITILDDADITHAISLSNLLKLTVNDKVTHPVAIPIEHLASSLTDMNEKQTVAAVTVALVDLQGKIGDILKTIQTRHPNASSGARDGFGKSSGAGSGGHYSGAVNGDSSHNAIESKPLVLSAESLDQFLEPRKSLLARNASVSSQSSVAHTMSPTVSTPAVPQPSLSSASAQFQQPQQVRQQQQQQQQQVHPHQQQLQQQLQQQQQQQLVQQQPQPTQQPAHQVQQRQWAGQSAPQIQSSMTSPMPSSGPGVASVPQTPSLQYNQALQQQQQQPYGQYPTGNVTQQAAQVPQPQQQHQHQQQYPPQQRLQQVQQQVSQQVQQQVPQQAQQQMPQQVQQQSQQQVQQMQPQQALQQIQQQIQQQLQQNGFQQQVPQVAQNAMQPQQQQQQQQQQQYYQRTPYVQNQAMPMQLPSGAPVNSGY
ncbi:hypothetical protein BG005_004680 [Podila minutissima]|nr:hypothetical protein BG005_004680 [Podila minutissima]